MRSPYKPRSRKAPEWIPLKGLGFRVPQKGFRSTYIVRCEVLILGFVEVSSRTAPRTLWVSQRESKSP